MPFLIRSGYQKDCPLSVEDVAQVNDLISIDDYEEAYLNKELKKEVHVSFTRRKIIKNLNRFLLSQTECYPIYSAPYAHGKFYSTNAHTIMCTNVHIESDERRICNSFSIRFP